MRGLGPGARLGDYELLEQLGRGGMGSVWRATDASHGGRHVAVKLMEGTRDERRVARFQREAELAAAVKHRHLIGIHGFGFHEDTPYLVVELVEGGSLDDRLREGGPLPFAEAARRGAEIASALAAIHEKGLVHRDVKPGNVLIDATGSSRLCDFGLAKRLPKLDAESVENLTRTGELVGTLEFMAPEQIDRPEEVDGRSDLYALGILLHTLLVGRPPFEGAGFEVVKHHLVDPPPHGSDVVEGIRDRLDALIQRLLAKAPKDRPASAAEVAHELEAIAAGPGGARKRTAAVAVVLVLALGGGAAAALRAATPPPVRPPEPPVATPAPRSPPAPPAPQASAPSDEPGLESAPEWFRKLPTTTKRPRLPLPGGLTISPTAGEYVNDRDGSVLLYVPAGELTMGRGPRHRADIRSEDREKEHAPEHEVRLSAYFFGKLEVTNAQWRHYVSATGATPQTGVRRIVIDLLAAQKQDALPRDPFGVYYDGTEVASATPEAPQGPGSGPPRGDHPVVQVTHEEALGYCAWAGVLLPTEAQWERAANGPGRNVRRRFPWTPDDPIEPGRKLANVLDRSAFALLERLPDEAYRRRMLGALDLAHDDGFPRTSPVGSFPEGVSPTGARDMGGNVNELCRDVFLETFYETARAQDPVCERADAKRYCVRGGSWAKGLPFHRVYDRQVVEEGISQDDLGFRVVRELDRK